ncbi:Hydrolase family protein (plasmid) [Roseomonas mucosa]|nr:Hydrolase family protein [Roseomonas mucosa]
MTAPLTYRLSHALLHLPAAWGAAAPVLLVHGGYHGASCWDEWRTVLSGLGLPSAALDLRGHGALAEASLSPTTGVADYAADVGEAVSALREMTGQTPVLVGHSLGALVVLAATAANVPSTGLALLAPSPPGNLPGVAAVPEVPEGQLLPSPVEAVATARWMGGQTPPSPLREQWLAGLCPESPRALNDRYTLRIQVEPEALKGLPVLVMEAGRDDAERHPAGQDAAIAAFLGGEHLLLAEAPHCLMFGDPGREAALWLADWMARIGVAPT